MDDDQLELMFSAARAAPPPVPAALMHHVLADAIALHPGAAPPAGWQRWVGLLGGAPGLGGLVAAGCVGVWLGIAPPSVVPDVAALFLEGETTGDDPLANADPLNGFGWGQEDS